MIWEDARVRPNRKLRRYDNGVWVNVPWTAVKTLVGQSQIDGTYLYDARNLTTDITDGWVKNNWWRHYEDLSPSDRALKTNEDQAIRPILEFWNGIETVPGDVRDFRNDFPVFQLYMYRLDQNDIQPLTDTYFPGIGLQGRATIYQYQVGTGTDDFVLGFPLRYNSTGEFQFELTMETTPLVINGTNLLGYSPVS